jgi:hypothetical protein
MPLDASVACSINESKWQLNYLQNLVSYFEERTEIAGFYIL